ncbi:MAG: hypothetical protein D6744_06005 [Planctomycetota bacterium]|nr:MAG: hypothetical protein D6744_06005 [Planctomycetota bacterium]
MLAVLTGCSQRPPVTMDDPELRAFVDLMMPRSIEIQKYLTRPRDFDGNGVDDGIEIILAVNDSFDDPIKCVGEFHFELYTLRMASGDRLGERVAFWPVKVNDAEAVRQYWDRMSRFFQFDLQFPDNVLPTGRYILTARLRTPTGEQLFDQYEFSQDR